MQHCDQEASSKYWWVFILLQKVFIDDRLAAVTAPGSRRAMLTVLSVHRIGRFKTRTPVSIPVNAHDGCSCLSYASKLRQPTLSTVTWTDKQSRSYDGNSSTSCLTDSISRWWSLLLESSRAEVGFVSMRFLWSPIVIAYAWKVVIFCSYTFSNAFSDVTDTCWGSEPDLKMGVQNLGVPPL